MKATVMGACAMALAALSATPARADVARVGTRTEAWYQTTCTAASCPPGLGPVNPHPAGTLHVGMTAGQEESRSYLTLDIAALPSGARLRGGTLTAPVSPDAGTRSAESAEMRACLVTETFEHAEGSTEAPPAVNCKVSSRGVYRAASPRATFTFDLTPFAGRWSTGAPDRGVALLAAESTQAASWHVGFDGKDRAGGVPITAVLSYDTPEQPGEGDIPTTQSPPSRPAENLLPPSGVAVLAAPKEPMPPPVSGEAITVAQPAPPTGLPPAGSYRYPFALLVPLVLLALGGLLAPVITHPIPRSTRP